MERTRTNETTPWSMFKSMPRKSFLNENYTLLHSCPNLNNLNISYHKLTGSETRMEEHACMDAVISSLSPSHSLIKCRSHPKKPVITTGWGNGVPAELCDLPKHTSQTGQAGWGFPVSDTHTPCAIQPRHWDLGAGSKETNKQLLHCFLFLRSNGFFQINTRSQRKTYCHKIIGRGRGFVMAVALPEIAHPLFNSHPCNTHA